MKLRVFNPETDFERIRNWTSDERAHALWCANRFRYPLEKNDFTAVMSDLGQRTGDVPFVAVMDNDRAVGFFCYSPAPDSREGKLKFVIVDPECRGKGIARQMLQLAVSHAFENADDECVSLIVFTENPRAKRCYEKTGFREKESDCKPFVYGDELWGRCCMTMHAAQWRCSQMKLDPFVDERDFTLLEQDRYTFFVLRRIIGGSCRLLLSNHENLMICYTGEPYPVWIWTADGAPDEILEKAYRLAAENGFVKDGQRFNIKYDLAEYMIRRTAEDGKELSVSTNMFAYDCPEPMAPSVKADGDLHRCTAEDLDELAEFLDLFHQEIGIDRKDAAGYRADAQAYIDSGNMYLWKNAQGLSVASCKYAPDGSMASVNLVFTRTAYRRKHYAQNLVYRVTAIAKEAGFIPMLYTDADYAASNACYEKIGYILRGKLCTVTVKDEAGT